MGTVYDFPCPEFTFYLPLDAEPGDVYEAITIPDDSLSNGTIYEGDVVLVKLGFIQSSGLHAIQTATGSVYVGFLTDKGNDLISLDCNNDEYEPEIFRRDEIEILGRVVQVYPGGDLQYRWELIRAPHVEARAVAK